MSADGGPGRLLYQGADWDFATIRRVYDAVEEIALGELGLDIYPNQIEVISAEQMLDAYASNGMPLLYRHWSFGKRFARHEGLYRKGFQGLAYEIVINSSPCISYIMEENTATMQALVIAHAAFGHNHFFKNNYLFRQWTDAEGILPYLDFAKSYVAKCEDRYGHAAVERVLDAAHALMSHGVHRYPRRKRPDLRSEERRERERREHEERVFNDLWRTVPGKGGGATAPALDEERRRALLELPQENILYFLEKTAPRLQPWQREILRIVRHVAQYFYPQAQTKLMNEGCASWVHYQVMQRLHERGRISDGHFLEFLHSHTNVVFQPEFDDPRYSGINPYALGFAMMEDIARIATDPTAEDREWFPDFAGCGDALGVLRDAWANYRDESFVAQFLSPALMRRLRLFHLLDDPEEDHLQVVAIHDERGFRRLRRALSRQYDIGHQDPDIQVVDVDLAGDRRLILHHRAPDRQLLDAEDARLVLQHLADLWGYDVMLKEIDPKTEAVLKEHHASARPGMF
ncbi:SpoVR family protein [Caldovatus aquaticus]|uniref:SpoVR family protein n=1 Tax=Caldovatus aquaticus TaxID=2865671 RepID=A0ABS7F5U0_9PROT|nr:SpoVR family protein [Caldovatus aquaticus]MBW8270145.1 SpoVR family protein [Caldovatus aquaticus]